MNKRTVVLGECTYEIAELPARKNAGWRKELEERLQPLLSIVEKAGAGRQVEITAELTANIRQAVQLVVTAPDVATEFLFAYSPELAAHRERIMETVYDSELMPAFMTVLGLAYPLGSLAKLVSLASGSMPTPSAPTSMSSPSLNGAHSAKSLTT